MQGGEKKRSRQRGGNSFSGVHFPPSIRWRGEEVLLRGIERQRLGLQGWEAASAEARQARRGRLLPGGRGDYERNAGCGGGKKGARGSPGLWTGKKTYNARKGQSSVLKEFLL